MAISLVGFEKSSLFTFENAFLRQFVRRASNNYKIQGIKPSIIQTLFTDPNWAGVPQRTLQQELLLKPTQWFTDTRRMQRKIILHLGPTNSGKTFRSLQKLKTVSKGYYGGPLRLLAREVYDKFHEEGTPCNLLTGEEIVEEIDSFGNKAGITSGTIEMIPLNVKFDLVVLDEIQMMASLDRGRAWTNALLGVRAREVHVCGEPRSLPLLKKIVDMTGDKLVINEYERLGKLKVESHSLRNDYTKLKPGDCLVAFSKKRILDLKLDIERKTKFKVAVIYGSLPPETRVTQARLFNSGEYDILVASDAIGMGLNLNIDRIIFTTDKKFNGKEMVPLSHSEIKQIAGRAGRYNPEKNGSVGYISALEGKTLEVIKSGMESPMDDLEKAVVWPPDEILARMLVQDYPPGTPVSVLLRDMDNKLQQKDKIFVLSDLDDKLRVLSLFENMDGISLFDKLRLSTAPVKSNPQVQQAFVQFCDTIAKGHTKGLIHYPFPFHLLDHNNIRKESANLEKYESLYNIITLYLWLHNRYPQHFVDVESARELKLFCELIIFQKLQQLRRNPYSMGRPH